MLRHLVICPKCGFYLTYWGYGKVKGNKKTYNKIIRKCSSCATEFDVVLNDKNDTFMIIKN